MATRLKLTDHPRWSLYKKIRRAVKHDLEATYKRMGISSSVTEETVDAFLRVNPLGRSVRKLFREDLETRESRRRDEIREMLEIT